MANMEETSNNGSNIHLEILKPSMLMIYFSRKSGKNREDGEIAKLLNKIVVAAGHLNVAHCGSQGLLLQPTQQRWLPGAQFEKDAHFR